MHVAKDYAVTTHSKLLKFSGQQAAFCTQMENSFDYKHPLARGEVFIYPKSFLEQREIYKWIFTQLFSYIFDTPFALNCFLCLIFEL